MSCIQLRVCGCTISVCTLELSEDIKLPEDIAVVNDYVLLRKGRKGRGGREKEEKKREKGKEKAVVWRICVVRLTRVFLDGGCPSLPSDHCKVCLLAK